MTVEAPDYLREITLYWQPRERLGGAEWASRERILGTDENAQRPGRFRPEPWQVEILDALADPKLDWLVILKAAQVGCSELVRCAIGRWALLDPGDVLWVMADQISAEKAMRKLQRMFRNTPALRPLLSPRRTDTKLLELILTNGMRIVIGWAGSAQSLASDPFRYVVLDETGKYKGWVGKEASPVDLAKERTKTFGRRAKIVLLSSPAHEEDLICTSFEECLDRREFAVPCACCGEVQELEWSQVRWPGPAGGTVDPTCAPSEPRERLLMAALVEADQSAWFECVSCKGRVGDVRRAMREPGATWIRAELDDQVTDTVTRRRGYHIGEQVHWETTTSDLAAKWLRCIKPAQVQGFSNGSLGLPHRDAATEIPAALFRNRAIHPAEVPSWATAILSTADTQLDHFWFMVRAWGRGGRSRLLAWGRAESFEELKEKTLRARFQLEGRKEGETARPEALLIDSGGGMERQDGSRTHDVYLFARQNPQVIAYKGDGSKESLAGRPVWTSRVQYTPPGRTSSMDQELHLANANYWKDYTAKLIKANAPVLWEESEPAKARAYGRQMASQHKVTETSSKGTKTYWKNRSKHGADHLWDCAYMQSVLAEILEVEDRETVVASVRQNLAVTQEPDGDAWVDGDGWWDE